MVYKFLFFVQISTVNLHFNHYFITRFISFSEKGIFLQEQHIHVLVHMKL